MAYKIPTQNGHYIINDDRRVTLSVAWTDAESKWLSEKIKLMVTQNKPTLEGYDYVYEEDLPTLRGIHRRHLYFARAGTYHFIPKYANTLDVLQPYQERMWLK